MSAPTPGRIVLYKLSQRDAESILLRRSRGEGVGNVPREGDVVPAIVVRVWQHGINGQAILDGNDSLWLTSRPEGDEPGTWLSLIHI